MKWQIKSVILREYTRNMQNQSQNWSREAIIAIGQINDWSGLVKKVKWQIQSVIFKGVHEKYASIISHKPDQGKHEKKKWQGNGTIPGRK